MKKRIRKNNIYKRLEKKKKQLSRWIEIHPWKTLFIVYIFFVLIKIFLTQLFIDPSQIGDRYVYSKMAQSFIQGEGFSVNGIPTQKYPPLYPIVISPAYFFNDIIIVTRTILIINSFVSSLIIFPAYLISRNFIDIKKSIFVSIVISILPVSMAYIVYYNSENLFIPLVLATFYFLYMAITKENHRYMIFSGFFIGLCLLTKYTAIVFFPAFLLVVLVYYFLIYYNSNKPSLFWMFKGIKYFLIISIISFITFLPWLLRNSLTHGFNLTGMIGYRTEILTGASKIVKLSEGTGLITNFIVQNFIQLGFLILGCGIVFLFYVLVLLYKSFKNKNTKLFYVCSLSIALAFFLILLTAFHGLSGGAWRLHGRYIEVVIPILIVVGCIAFFKLKFPRKILYFILFSLPIFIIVPTYSTGVIGNLSTSYIWFFHNANPERYFKFAPELGAFIASNIRIFLFIFLILILVLFVFFMRKKRKKLIFIFTIVIFLVASIYPISLELHYAKSKIESSSCYELGYWVYENTKNSDGTLLLDQNMSSIGGNGTKLREILGSWTTSPVRVSNISEIVSFEDINYIITLDQLDEHNFTLVKTEEILIPIGTIDKKYSKYEIPLYIFTPNKDKS